MVESVSQLRSGDHSSPNQICTLEIAQCVLTPQEKLTDLFYKIITYLEIAQCVLTPQEKLTKICVQFF